MRNASNSKHLVGICILVAGLFLSPNLGGTPASSACGDDGVDLQIVTDKTSYTPGTIMHVKFLITNLRDTSLYIFRSVNQCSSPLGWLSLEIRDRRNRNVEVQQCSGDIDVGALNVVQVLSDPRTGVVLQKNEIYGTEQDYELPKPRGSYRLLAEFAPAGLTEDQNQELSQHRMRVIHNTCSAAIVSITVE
jgi:hypothetical protein